MVANEYILAREHTFVSLRRVIQMERKLNDYRVSVDPTTLANALVLMAEEFAKQRCRVEECEVCAGFVDEWHELYDSLDTVRHNDVRHSLLGRLIPLPHIWSEEF